MRDSKLQKKAIRLVLQIYLLVFLFSVILCAFFVVAPLKENTIEQYEDQNQYILAQVDAQLNTVKEYANYIAYSADFMEHLNHYLSNPEDAIAQYELESNLYSFRNLKQGIQSIVVEVEDFSPVSSILELKKEEQAVLDSDWYQRIRQSNYSGAFSRGILMEKGGEPAKVMAYSQNYHFKNRKFTLTIFLGYWDLLGNNMRYYRKYFDQQYWMTVDGKAYFQDDQEAISRLLNDFEQGGERIQSNSKGVLLREELQNMACSSVAFISNQTLYQEVWKNAAIILLMAVLLLMGTMFVVIYIVKRVTSPVYRLARAMDQVVADNFAKKLPVESDDEIGDLSRTFNTMSGTLQEYFRRLVENMEAEQEMKLGLLISQIDPHFVCNTLNTIKYLAIQNRTKDVVIVSAALSSILRDRLRVKKFQIYDTVQQEIETIRQYLTIQQYRYGGEVQVEWEIDPEAETCRIPKNIIQPLVENALFHGLSHEEDGSVRGTIHISLQKKDGLQIRVRDDGSGMSQDKIQRLLSCTEDPEEERTGHGIGIYNIRERLEILYGNKAQFFIHSEIGEWTEMEIVIREG